MSIASSRPVSVYMTEHGIRYLSELQEEQDFTKLTFQYDYETYGLDILEGICPFCKVRLMSPRGRCKCCGWRFRGDQCGTEFFTLGHIPTCKHFKVGGAR